jgi:hypothetical protein
MLASARLRGGSALAMGSLIVAVWVTAAAPHDLTPAAAAATRHVACQRKPVLVSFRAAFSTSMGYEVQQVVLRHVDPRRCGGLRLRVQLSAPSILLAQRIVRAPFRRSTVVVRFSGVRAEDVTGVSVTQLRR